VWDTIQLAVVQGEGIHPVQTYNIITIFKKYICILEFIK
jgi:hypothetical protein